jgi:hypothetical protein
MMEQLVEVEAPEAVWLSIEAALQEHRLRHTPAALRWRWAFGAAILMAVAAGTYWRLSHQSGSRWEVVRIDGLPRIDAKPIHGAGRIGAGEWIETDNSSRAAIQVGAIGSVEIAPNSRVRVVTARASEHRLALARGQIRAVISAPPRLFFVDTAAGTAVDLGCEYTLSTDEEGSGLLNVTRGWVLLQWKGLESLVPAGASCRTHPQAGPGIPYFDDASETLKQSIESAGAGSLAIILSESRIRDTLTLWHLLSRVEPPDRARVYDRMAALTPVPPGVSRDKALQLDPETLNRWREELAWTW